jgi:predicted acylesterase/phospholipase RssA
MDSEQQAEAITAGARADLRTVSGLADGLRDGGRPGLIAPLLVAVSRRALYEGWEPGSRAELAKTLRDHEQFGYARRLLGRVRNDGPDSEELRQQHALCTYKDMELPAARRLDRALQILTAGRRLEDSTSAETLGIAGAIYKRKWELDAKRVDLESALWCYERGFAQVDDFERWYPGINAAFVSDQLAALEEPGLGGSEKAADLRAKADRIRAHVVEGLQGGDGGWADAALGEAHFGLGQFDDAREHLARTGAATTEIWRRESTAMQVAALAQLRGLDPGEAAGALGALVGGRVGAIDRATTGKLGLALSGGGFRASLFHIGVLARLAESNVLRHVEVLSCVSGGSIVGAYYYLKLRQLLQAKEDHEIEDADYVTLVDQLGKEFLDGVQLNLRGRLSADIGDNWRMLSSRFSRTDRAGELFQQMFFSKVAKDARDDPSTPWHMTDLPITPSGRKDFALHYENWLRQAKVPMLVLNATTLNTGHGWQFTASWMGEPPVSVEEQVDASRRLRRVYYRDAPHGHREPRLGKAVAASACVPGLFPPVTLEQLYDGIDVELVDGGVHDNQGIASLLEQDCTVILVSDASGQIRDDEHPARGLYGVANRANSILMSRVRGAQYSELSGRRRSGTLRGLMVVHLKKGLAAPPRDWSGCQEPYDPVDDAPPPGVDPERTPYAIDLQVQRALSELRTDLDAFSDDEAYALMAAGYEMTRCELSKALPDLPQTDPAFNPSLSWPFTPTLENLANADGQSGLAEALRPGRARFFRGSVARRLRRTRARGGTTAAAGGRDRSASRDPGRRARVVADVLSPVRKIASAPFALAGALGTRLHLRARRGIGGSS